MYLRRRVRAFVVGLILLATSDQMSLGQVWEPAGSVPTSGEPRVYAAGVSHGGALYAIGGTPWQNGGDRDGSVHRYANGTWAAVASVGGAGPIIAEAAGVDALGRLVVYGGFILDDDGAGPDRVYDPMDGLTDPIAGRAAPETAIGYFAWAGDDQQRLYGFGGGPGPGGPNSGYCDRYDAVADAWTELSSMPTPAADACAAYDGNGHMLVIGGIDANGTSRLANVARYDIATDSWSDAAVPDLPVALSGARAVLGADGRVYVIGGETGPIGSGVVQTAVYKLEPLTNAWVSVAPLATPRKWFAGVLADDDYIYAIGGDNEAGGTETVERLFTPRCPEIEGPAEQVAYSGSVGGFTVGVQGAEPFTYHWRKDQADLIDGPTGTGSTIYGAGTRTLTIGQPGPADIGVYDVVVTNDCGAVVSVSASLALREAPTAPAAWASTSIHPAWATGSSQAMGIGAGGIGGSAIVTTVLPDDRVLELAHPVLWDLEALIPADLTPPGSIGGAILDAEENLLAGWFWHIFNCFPYTCGWQSAGYWYADTRAFTETHISGAEYDHAVATDGVRTVSNAAFEYQEGFYTFRPYLWTPPHSVAYLDPGDVVERATVAAIDGDHQYGHLIPTGSLTVLQAAMWTNTAASLQNLHPPGYSESRIAGAGDGQAVGIVESGGVQRAALWAGGSGAVAELHHSAWNVSESVAARNGMQAGTADGHAVLWFGSASSFVDLHLQAPAGFTSSSAQDVEVSEDGTIRVAGYGYNPGAGVQEAILWRSLLRPGDCTGDDAVSLAEHANGAACLLGPTGGLLPACYCYDFDRDGHVTAADFATLQVSFTGP